MKTLTMTVFLTNAVLWTSLAEISVSPLNADQDRPGQDRPKKDDQGRRHTKIETVLYAGPLVHDQQWVLRPGTAPTDPWGGVPAGRCPLVPSEIRNQAATEEIRFEADYQGSGIWKMAWIDTVAGTAVGSAQPYRYTYYVRAEFIGPTTDGKAPNPSRAMPTSTDFGFLGFVPKNVVTDGYIAHDQFLLLNQQSSRVVADANVIMTFHLMKNPSEQPPPILPVVLEGFILTSREVIAGYHGCDPL